jgi:putative Holliday junction resolvase
MVILGLDVGEVRIGVACSDDMEIIARPIQTVRRKSNAQAFDAISRIAGEQGAERIVVGLPISFDGQLHAQARRIQAFAGKLGQHMSLPITFADESLSTVRAEELLRSAGVRPERIHERLDAAAAAVMLQDYLDARRQAHQAAPLEDSPGVPPDASDTKL